MQRFPQQQGASYALSDVDVLHEFGELVAWRRAATARQLDLIKQVDTRGLYALQGFSTLAMWLCQVMRVSKSSAAQLARLAKHWPDLPDVAKAMENGELSEDQADIIAAAVRVLPPASREEAQRYLAEHGRDTDLPQLAGFAEDVHHYLDPEGADELALKKLERQEKKAQDSRSLTLTPLGEGIVRISGRTSDEGAAIIQAALDPLCNPARRNLDGVIADSEEPLPLPLQDNRTATQRRHDAMLEIFQLALTTGDLPANGGDRAQVVVTMTLDALTNTIGAATFDTGARMTPDAARRIACDAGIVPAVLDSAGMPLDVGRERRLINGTLRRALVLRDKGCSFPHCDRPARWCQGHHAVSWLDGGITSIGNSVLVCGAHHRLLHHSDWQVFIAADGLPTFIPPRQLDPSQQPRRNTFHHRT